MTLLTMHVLPCQGSIARSRVQHRALVDATRARGSCSQPLLFVGMLARLEAALFDSKAIAKQPLRKAPYVHCGHSRLNTAQLC